MNHFSIRIWHVKKSGFYRQPATTSSAVGVRRSSKALPKAKVPPKKVTVTGGLLPVWSNTAFWILTKPLHLRSILSKSTRYTENYNAFSQYWLTERSQFLKTITDCTSHNQHLKRWRNWATKFCLICHIHLTSSQPTTTSSISTSFCRENTSTTFRRQKMLSKNSVNPEAWIFMLREWTNISHWQKWVDCNGS